MRTLCVCVFVWGGGGGDEHVCMYSMCVCMCVCNHSHILPSEILLGNTLYIACVRYNRKVGSEANSYTLYSKVI